MGLLNEGERAVYQRFRKLLENVDPKARVFHYLIGKVKDLEVTYALTRGSADQVICKCNVTTADRKKIELSATYNLEMDLCIVSEVKPRRG